MRRFVPLLLCLFAFAASAQVVQPVYTRQSKSAQVQAFTATQTSYVGAVKDFDSAVVETTSFNSVQMLVDFDALCTGDIIVLFSLTKTGPFIQSTLAAPNAFKDLDDVLSVPAIYNVSNIAPYIKFRFTTDNCPNGLNLSAVLVPFPSNVTVQGDKTDVSFPVAVGGYDKDNGTVSLGMTTAERSVYVTPKSVGFNPVAASPVAVSAASATTIYSGDTNNDVNIILQNQGTFPVRCGINAASATDYQFSLRAASVAGDGSGGVQQVVLKRTLPVKCISIGGAGSVSFTIY
jgi:hypothetical protein